MTAAMINTDMPTSGTVIFPVRTRASASCSADNAPRRVAHFAARLLATGAPAEAASDADAETCCNSTRSDRHRAARGPRRANGWRFRQQESDGEARRTDDHSRLE